MSGKVCNKWKDWCYQITISYWRPKWCEKSPYFVTKKCLYGIGIFWKSSLYIVTQRIVYEILSKQSGILRADIIKKCFLMLSNPGGLLKQLKKKAGSAKILWKKVGKKERNSKNLRMFQPQRRFHWSLNQSLLMRLWN